ncbi:MAG: DUF3343 domain-containing protein [Clostridiales bacterium]|nr:DUF3343 domain-containing protein [Clostridiales bacterium]
MIEILAVFKSRAQATDCNARLKGLNINCALIATPKECGVGCGLCVKFSQAVYPRAKAIILRSGYSAFYGFCLMRSVYGKVTVTKV